MDVKKIQWLEDRVLVLPDAASDKFEGTRLIKPDTTKAQEKANRGLVLAAGPGRIDPDTKTLRPQPLAAGQRILFGHWAGVQFEENGTKYLVMRPDDVFGVLPE